MKEFDVYVIQLAGKGRVADKRFLLPVKPFSTKKKNLFLRCMCYTYSNYIATGGGLVNKYRLRLSERQAISKEFAQKYSFYYTNGYDPFRAAGYHHRKSTRGSVF
jgi:hypothetical protein